MTKKEISELPIKNIVDGWEIKSENGDKLYLFVKGINGVIYTVTLDNFGQRILK